MKRRWIAGVLLASAMGVACGSAAGSTGGDAADPSPDSQQDQLLEFAQCMRDHGVEMPDPEMDDNGVVKIGPAPGQDIDPETMKEADEACRDLLPALEEPSEEDQAAMEDAMLAFAKCMRDHGIDMPDPSDGGFVITDEGDGGSVGPAVDLDDSDFQRAQEACQHLLPGRPGEDGGDP